MLVFDIFLLCGFAAVPTYLLVKFIQKPQGKPTKAEIAGIILSIVLSTVYAMLLMMNYDFY